MKLSQTLLKIRTYNEAVLGAGMLLLFGGIVTALILNNTAWWNWIPIVLGVLALAAFLAANLSEVKTAGKKRTVQVRANLTLVAAAMLGIVIALNYIVGRHPIRFDLTANQRYTLSEQTRDILRNLKQDVNVTMFVTAKPQRGTEGEVQRAQQLLEEYGKKSTKFRFKVVDADKNVAETKKMGVHEYNTVVFESGENRKDVLQRDYVTYAFDGRRPMPKFQGEGAFTAALMRMSDTAHPVFYFTKDHGEKDTANPQEDGLKTLKEMLESQNYAVTTLSLLAKAQIPEDASVLAVIAPSKPFQPAETKAVEAFLRKGGKLVLCVDPMDLNTHRMISSTGLEPVLKDYGIGFGNDIVVDSTSFNFPDVSQVIPQYSYHAIVEKLTNDHIASIHPFGRSVQKTTPALKGATQTVFLQSTDKGWGETNLKEKPLKFDKALDTKGPVPMGMACEWAPPESSNKKSRVVVYGNSSFLDNQFIRALGNLDLALNSFSWAAEDEKKISIHPKDEDIRVLNLSNVGVNLIKYLTVILLPLSVLVAGAIIWYRRRSL